MELEITKTNVGSRKSITIVLNEDQFQELKKDFSMMHDSMYKHKKEYQSNYCWNLGIIRVAEGRYKMWGSSGDYTFGATPWFYKTSLAGNIREGRIVFNKFIEEYSK